MVFTKVAAVLALFGVLVLTGCGPGAPKSGTIVEKWYEERREWDTTYYQTQCTGRDDKGNCTSSFTYPVTTHHVDDEDWMVKLEECNYNDSGERKCRTGKREIPRADWERLKEGEFYGVHNDN